MKKLLICAVMMWTAGALAQARLHHPPPDPA